MDDRELLELAAKAAGIRHIEYTNGYDGRDGLVTCDAAGRHGETWSPLNSDGDALRLAVACKLKLSITGDSAFAIGWVKPWADALFEPMRNRPAAVRRAIVRAAAAIAQEKQNV